MSTFVTRKIDELGRVVLPLDARSMMNLFPKDAVQISWSENEIIIKKAKPSCKMCGSEENVHEDLRICKACIDKIEAE